MIEIRRANAAGEALYRDVAGERLAERAGAGYVNPTHASMFLMKAKTTDLQTLRAARKYDLDTAEYLRKQQHKAEQPQPIAEQALSTTASEYRPQQGTARNISTLADPAAPAGRARSGSKPH